MYADDWNLKFKSILTEPSYENAVINHSEYLLYVFKVNIPFIPYTTMERGGEGIISSCNFKNVYNA